MLLTNDRGRLIEECQGLVRSLALRVQKSLPRHFELDDLISYGQVGLAEAARDFDPTRGGQFTTFAYYRIRGAIYDGISKMAWVNRAQYRRVKHQQMADDLLRLESEKQTPESGASWLWAVHRAFTSPSVSSGPTTLSSGSSSGPIAIRARRHGRTSIGPT